MKLLIVDDSNVIRRSIARNLTDVPTEVRMAGNGLEALTAIDEFEPDLVTMDITMPEMDGLACVAEILRRKPHVRILVVSALADKATAVEAVRRGAQGFLLKPFTAETLNEEIAELLEVVG
jgi:two-component system chemotaxis response regulator CheY